MSKSVTRVISVILALVLFISAASFSLVVQAGVTHTSDDGFVYVISGKYAEIIGYNGGSAALTVPASIDGYGVKRVKSLKGSNGTTSLEFESGIEEIGSIDYSDIEYAAAYKEEYTLLSDMKSLTCVTLSDTIRAIGIYAFYGSTRLADVNFSSAKSLNTIHRGAFMKCRAIDNIVMPEALRDIRDGAFSNCTALKSIRLNEGLYSVGNRAFAYSGIREFYIPSGVERFGELSADCNSKITHKRSVLHSCKRLRKITASDNNKILSDKDGILFSKDGTILYLYPAAKKGDTYKVPSIVEQIADFAFNYSANLRAVEVSEDTTQVNPLSFYRCSNIDSVIFTQAAAPISSPTVNNGVTSQSSSASGSNKKIEASTCSENEDGDKLTDDKSTSINKQIIPYSKKPERKPPKPRITYIKTKIVLII